MKNHKSCLFLSFIFYLLTFLFSCDLFSGSTDNDLLKKIDEEIAWANAAKLTVHISYDPYWGTSSPPIGQITQARDIRQGYDFALEFTPDAAFSLVEWRAFSGELESGWWDDPVQFEIDMQGRELEIGRDFALMSLLSPRGGNSTLKINVPGTITLVPWCRTEPRILRTEPRIPITADLPEFSKGMVLNIYFNSPLKESSMYDAITIRGTTNTTNVNVDYLPCYTVEYFEVAGQFVITFTPKPDNLPAIDTEIRLTIKTGEGGIQNAQGEWMPGSDIVYVWKTLNIIAGDITEWGADYIESDNTIIVSPWHIEGGYSKVEVSYTVNRGPRIPIIGSELEARTITAVGKINDTNIRQGIGVSSIEEYEIIFDIYVGHLLENSRSFKIWNIPGMSVSQADPMIEVTGPNGGYAVTSRGESIGLGNIPSDATGQYVLTNSFPVSEYNPISNFQGKFYGNGQTVTIKSFDPAYTGEDYGLFGVVGDGAVIRDLTVGYDAVVINSNGIKYMEQVNTGSTTSPNWVDVYATFFGGIAGAAEGSSPSNGAQFINVLVKGAATFNVSGDTTAYAGGLIALMTGTSTIYNAYGGLNINVNKTTGITSSVNVGGITGSMGIYKTGAFVKLEEASAVGNITVTASVGASYTHGWFLSVGGLAGFIHGIGNDAQYAVLRDCDYSQGTIEVICNDGFSNIGGAVGYIEKFASLSECAAMPRLIDFTYNGSRYINVGGFLGGSLNGTSIITNCYATGNIKATSNASIAVGGFAGEVMSDFSNCYSTGDVIAELTSVTRQNIFAGGFSGIMYGEYTISNCYATGNVNARSVGIIDPIYAGGLIGSFADQISMVNCYAMGSVSSHSASTRSYAGGLVGISDNSNIQDSAALGASVTATGPSPNAGRIYGNIHDYYGNPGTVGTFTNNRAYSSMRVYEGGTASSPTEITASISGNDHGSKHGLNATDADFRRRDIWQNDAPPGEPSTWLTEWPGTFHGMGFDPTVWDFSTVDWRGRPILRNLGGQ
ncbi:MAG: hypothetical protein FWG99_07965 [Treponema sp.]|nr:hypothetical protein [Treponema sp.]